MSQRKTWLYKVIAATSSLAVIAGCDASLMTNAGVTTVNRGGAVTPGTVTGGALSPVTTTPAQVNGNATTPAKAQTPVSAGNSVVTPIAADSANLEADVEAYNAIAADAEANDTTLPARYSLAQFDDPAEDWAAPDQRGGSSRGNQGGYSNSGYGNDDSYGGSSYGSSARGGNDTTVIVSGGRHTTVVFAPRITVIVQPGSRYHYTPVPARQPFTQILPTAVRKQAAPVQQKVQQRDTQRLSSAEEQAVKSLLALAHWNHDASDASLLVKEASLDLSHTDGNGSSVARKIHIKRTINAATRDLVAGVTDLSETLADGSSNTVHWEKSLQDDGSYDVVFHHEHKNADGSEQVTDWEKLIAANGDITGTGVTTKTDASGTVTSSETITLGGNESGQQQISDGGSAASPTPAPTTAPTATPTPAPEATATPTPEPTAEATATPTPAPTATADAGASGSAG